MPFNLGDNCFYYYGQEATVDTFGTAAGVGRITGVSADGTTYAVVVFPKGASYVVGHSSVIEGTGPGQVSSTPPPPPVALAADDPGAATKPAPPKPQPK
jgi:hypothetical protein